MNGNLVYYRPLAASGSRTCCVFVSERVKHCVCLSVCTCDCELFGRCGKPSTPLTNEVATVLWHKGLDHICLSWFLFVNRSCLVSCSGTTKAYCYSTYSDTCYTQVITLVCLIWGPKEGRVHQCICWTWKCKEMYCMCMCAYVVRCSMGQQQPYRWPGRGGLFYPPRHSVYKHNQFAACTRGGWSSK